MLDEARSPRPGEVLDAAQLQPYLESALGGRLDGPLEVLQFPGGHSNLTYLLRGQVSGAPREWVLRRPPFGSQVKSAHDMGREFRVLEKLHPVFGRAPRPLCYCADESLLGARFYVMERLRGVILRREPPAGYLPDEDTVRRLCEAFVDTLVELHRVDYAAAGLSDFGHPTGYVERQVSGWTRRYRDAQTGEVPEIDAVAAWLHGHQPVSPAPALIHNDYKHDNLVLDPGDATRIVGILDWEMATVGDPLMDLGTALCYWVQADDAAELRALRFGPTTLPGSFSRRALADRYAAQSGLDLSAILFYYVFGLFKTAVVVQQIYYRFHQGLTQDRRFAGLGEMARLLARQAGRALERGEI